VRFECDVLKVETLREPLKVCKPLPAIYTRKWTCTEGSHCLHLPHQTGENHSEVSGISNRHLLRFHYLIILEIEYATDDRRSNIDRRSFGRPC
jgi:hypothetical protein